MVTPSFKLMGLGLCAIVSATSFTEGYLRLQPALHQIATTTTDRTVHLQQVLGQATIAATPRPTTTPTPDTTTRNIFQATSSSSINLNQQTTAGTICLNGQCHTVPGANQSTVTTCVNGQCATTNKP